MMTLTKRIAALLVMVPAYLWLGASADAGRLGSAQGAGNLGEQAARGIGRYARALLTAMVSLNAAACGGSPPSAEQTAPASRSASESAVEVFVSDETTGNVVIVDPNAGEVIATVPVGKRPRGLRLASDGRHLLVALSGSPIAGPGVDESALPAPDRPADGIGVVDIAARKLVRMLESGQDPETFDVSADGKTIYVSNEETAEMSVVDVETGTVRTKVNVCTEPEGVTLHPDGGVVYVTCEADNEVIAVDTAKLEVVARIKTGARPRAVAISPDGATAFVSAENAGDVSVFDTRTHKPMPSIAIPATEGTPTRPRPMGVLFSTSGEDLFVSLGRAESVAHIDGKQQRILRSIEGVGTRVWGIAISPDSRKLYTANGPSGDVSVIDIESGTVDRRISVGDSPWGVVARRAGQEPSRAAPR